MTLTAYLSGNTAYGEVQLVRTVRSWKKRRSMFQAVLRKTS